MAPFDLPLVGVEVKMALIWVATLVLFVGFVATDERRRARLLALALRMRKNRAGRARPGQSD